MFQNEFSFLKEGLSLLGFNYLIHNYVKQQTLLREKKRIINERNGIIPKGPSTNETLGPMQVAVK